ncbi:recombinase family protein [Streptomyces sp. Edi4]|uniref:recombinase family protein n=1 Tax=Streptomyces sp. Edi4 TaxID=3162527 RepID=UPI003305E637
MLFGLGASVYGWDDPFGRLFLQTLAMVAEFEANLNHLRTREGMAIAKRKGKLNGKQPKLRVSVRRSIRCHTGRTRDPCDKVPGRRPRPRRALVTGLACP